MRRFVPLTAFLSLSLAGCVASPTYLEDEGGDAGEAGDGGDGDGGGDTNGDPPDKDPEGEADYPGTRALTRLTADQYVSALEVVTGQTWVGFEDFKATLGKPDFVSSTEEVTTYSVSFDKIAHDAARDTCRDAVDLDVAGEQEGEPVILRFADPSERSPDAFAANLRYLYLRFLVEEVDQDDARLDPFMELLQAAPPDGEELTDERMADRWWAVCVALSTHPDFVAY